MILPPAWSRSTDHRRVAAFAVVNVGLPLVLSGGLGSLWTLLVVTGHGNDGWGWLGSSVLMLVWGGAGLFMLWCGTCIANWMREMGDV